MNNVRRPRPNPGAPARLLRDDPSFQWAAADACLAAWRQALAEWATQDANKRLAVRVGNTLLDDLKAHPATARHPEEFCRRAYRNPHPYAPWANSGHMTAAPLANGTHAFFEWFLKEKLTIPDDHGRPMPSPDHWNPIARMRSEAHATETARQAMPTRLIRELLRLLTENDWAWGKSHRADWATITDPETGGLISVWCPVRAAALALKLLLPLRTFQVRMLESGEGDSETYADEAWCANRSPLAPPQGRIVRRGFLRAFRDRATGAVSTGFFVNTNKTADRLPDAGEVGYEMPWQHDEAIAVVESLLRWQAIHNPVFEPLAWSCLHDATVRLSGARAGRAFFLMRDPNGTHHNEPVSDKRLGSLWSLLMGALEDRLNARGDRMADGSPIRLTERVENGTRTRRRSLYDLHSLRVSLITALATDGGVPLHILSKCIAGHASLVMTLYYIKTDAATLTQCLTEATAKIDGASHAQFARYLKSPTRAPEGLVSNDPTGVAALDRSAPASWTVLDTGICPVGGTRCAEGGPLLAKNIHGPVPGGMRNCVRCRFHITGPAFLGGLVARFNAASMRIESAKRERDAAQQGLEAAEDQQYDREKGGAAGDAGELARAQERRELAEAALMTHTGTLQAVYGLVERCKAVSIAGDPGLHLVLVGGTADLATAVRHTSDLDLLDAVCQAATVHPCEEAVEASLRRSQVLDRMLLRNGRAPVLMQLSEVEALRVGNEMMRLMTHQIGRQAALEVIDGTSGLLEAGVAAHVDAFLASSPVDPSRDRRCLDGGETKMLRGEAPP